MNKYRYFKCIKSFTVHPVDDDGTFLDNGERIIIYKDSMWEVRFNQHGEPSWIAYQVDGYGVLMELRKENWEDTEYFVELEGLE